ncbi:hypothetical protein ACOSQ3_003863 [Xanthoceras sorbifolium]
MPFDINGCWSGFATILPSNKPVILYTGIDPQQRQVQNYAVPSNLSDPYLRKWTKPDNNPLVVPDQGINVTAFRDPTTAWLGIDGHWRILVGGKRKSRGMTFLCWSREFVTWVKAKHPLHSSPETVENNYCNGLLKSWRHLEKNKISNDNGYSSGDNKDNNHEGEKKKKYRKGPLTTVVLKVALNSQGHKLILGFKGVTHISVDKQKQLVTVKGTMDGEALTKYMKDTLKRPVEIVPPKEDDEDTESNDSDNGCDGYNVRGYMAHDDPSMPIETIAIDCDYNARGYIAHNDPGIAIETVVIDCDNNARGYLAHDDPGIAIETAAIDCEYNAKGCMVHDEPLLYLDL